MQRQYSGTAGRFEPPAWCVPALRRTARTSANRPDAVPARVPDYGRPIETGTPKPESVRKSTSPPSRSSRDTCCNGCPPSTVPRFAADEAFGDNAGRWDWLDPQQINKRYERGSRRVEFPRAESRWCLQNLVCPAQLKILPTQPPQLREFLTRRSRPRPGVKRHRTLTRLTLVPRPPGRDPHSHSNEEPPSGPGRFTWCGFRTKLGISLLGRRDQKAGGGCRHSAPGAGAI